jgi:mono/diheme cytochrome c family protein
MLFNRTSLNWRHAFLLTATFLIASSCTPKTGDDKKPRDTSAKFTQYYNRGEELYLQHCSNCHQKDGTGLGLLFPPLNKSDYLDNNLDAVLCLMRHGKSGELLVNGRHFNKEMTGIATLSDLEIAEIATYIYNTWENERGMIEVSYVSNALQTCETSH